MFSKVKDQFKGREIITTNRRLTGEMSEDANIVIEILKESLDKHKANADVEDNLFDIFFNSDKYWDKEKTQRGDINNKVTVGSAWSATRTINSYCFGEPIKIVCRNTNEAEGKQAQVEILSEYLDVQHNHDATIMATLCSSVCGLGYKLALPATKAEYDFSGVPFVINNKVIRPQDAFCVYSNSVIGEKVLGVIIGKNYDKDGNEDGSKYTVWTSTHQYVIVDGDKDDKMRIVPFVYEGKEHLGAPTFINRIPLIEVERNAFRKGDWEIAVDLFELKNRLASNRIDDIEQIVDYILVLINCDFETKDEKDSALKDRLISLEQKDPQNKPSVEILKNAIDQGGVQVFADYIDALIDTTIGIPSRQERSGGGHDTGKAVVYRNGFRDLENNAGIIIPKMDKAELEFLGVCIAYSHNRSDDKLNKLKTFDVRNKFTRSLSDDPISASSAYATFRAAGMNDLDALIASQAVTDPSEVHKNNVIADEEREKKEEAKAEREAQRKAKEVGEGIVNEKTKTNT